MRPSCSARAMACSLRSFAFLDLVSPLSLILQRDGQQERGQRYAQIPASVLIEVRHADCLLPSRPVDAASRCTGAAGSDARIKDYATVPITGAPLGSKASSNEMLLARVNAIREEPGGADRLFVADMNGPLYILDKKTRQFTQIPRLRRARRSARRLFHRLFITCGYGNGLNGFYFDPDYRRNGKFYTVHMEDPNLTVSNMPDNKNHPGLNLSGYTTTPTSRRRARRSTRGCSSSGPTRTRRIRRSKARRAN